MYNSGICKSNGYVDNFPRFVGFGVQKYVRSLTRSLNVRSRPIIKSRIRLTSARENENKDRKSSLFTQPKFVRNSRVPLRKRAHFTNRTRAADGPKQGNRFQ